MPETPTMVGRIALPPRYAVRNYMKAQSRTVGHLIDMMNDCLMTKWQGAYRGKKLGPRQIEALAQEYSESLSAIGAFSVQISRVAGKKVLPNSEKSIVSGYLMDSVALGQGGPGSRTAPYVENVVTLRTCRAVFRPKGAMIGLGFGCVSLTQHVLERLYERKELDHASLANLIHQDISDLLECLALAEIADLWIYSSDDDVSYQVAVIPYSSGLMFVNRRIVLANSPEGELGFRIEVPSGKVLTPFINTSSLIRDFHSIGSMNNSVLQPAYCILGLTYFNELTLTGEQATYYYLFKALREKCTPEELSIISLRYFSPQFGQEKNREFAVGQPIASLVEKLNRSLRSGWVKPHHQEPLCYILPFDHVISQ